MRINLCKNCTHVETGFDKSVNTLFPNSIESMNAINYCTRLKFVISELDNNGNSAWIKPYKSECKHYEEMDI